MAIRHVIKSLGLGLLLVLLSRCSGGSQQKQDGDPVNGTNTLDNSNSAALNGEGKGGKKGGKGGNAAAGEGMNNATGTGDDFAGANAGAGEGMNNAAGAGGATNPLANTPPSNAPIDAPVNTQTPPANAAAPLNAGATANTPPLNPSATGNLAAPKNGAALADIGGDKPADAPATPPPAATAPAPAAAPDTSLARAAASPFTNPHMNWAGKGKVKYVTRSITKHAQPNGPVVGEYETGDHPLVFQDGNWVELNDGSFVKGNGLTDKPTGRNHRKQLWQ